MKTKVIDLMMKFALSVFASVMLLIACLSISGCSEPEQVVLPPQAYSIGDHVTTTLGGNDVAGVIQASYFNQYFNDRDVWSYRIKYLNERGNVQYEWFAEDRIRHTRRGGNVLPPC